MISRNKYWFPDEDGTVEFYYPDKTIVGNFQDNGCLTVDELKAIYKQAEELGWL